jgi:hypothetical protein
MTSPTFKLVAICLFTILTLCRADATLESDFASSDIVTRDVTIIGGGSSGTYAAIRLRELGHSVAVVEQKDTLGGHVNTFFDPVTGESVDYGVIVFEAIPVVLNYFAHFNITLVQASALGSSSYFDFQTASPVNPAQVFTGNITQAFEGYLAQLSKFPNLFSNGYQLPYPVPEDLLLPFGDFLDK